MNFDLDMTEFDKLDRISAMEAESKGDQSGQAIDVQNVLVEDLLLTKLDC